MRLHRTISPDLPLLVVALDEEAAHLHDTGLPVLVTGAGKVNAAIAVASILAAARPTRVVNLGTAGALRDGMTGTHIIAQVLQHDLDDDALFALTDQHFGPSITLAGSGPRLATGDVFVSDHQVRVRLASQADLVDMEGYSVARAAQDAGVPVTLVKNVSDNADESAGRSWKQTVDECAEQLGAWVRRELLG